MRIRSTILLSSLVLLLSIAFTILPYTMLVSSMVITLLILNCIVIWNLFGLVTGSDCELSFIVLREDVK